MGGPPKTSRICLLSAGPREISVSAHTAFSGVRVLGFRWGGFIIRGKQGTVVCMGPFLQVQGTHTCTYNPMLGPLMPDLNTVIFGEMYLQSWLNTDQHPIKAKARSKGSGSRIVKRENG